MKPELLMRLAVSELMTPTVAFSAVDPVSKVVGFLRESKLYEAFVEEEDRTALIAVRDLLDARDISALRVSTLMHYVNRLNPKSTVSDAATLMHDHRIRSLPVYRGKRLVGQINATSIVSKLLETETGMKVSSIMSPDPIVVRASDRVGKAKQIMTRRKVDQLPVMDGGSLRGVVSSDQIAFNLIPWADRNVKGDWRVGRFDTPVGEFAAKDFVSNDIGDSLNAIFGNMRAKGTNYSLIESLGEVHGIVTYRDFMKILARRVAEDFPIYMIGLPDDPFEAETAKNKFVAAIHLLRRTFPEITEARAIIKMGETESPAKKYQVRIFIMSPYRHYSYHVFSRELADAFDYVNGWVKRIISGYAPKSKRVMKEVVQYTPSRPSRGYWRRMSGSG